MYNALTLFVIVNLAYSCVQTILYFLFKISYRLHPVCDRQLNLMLGKSVVLKLKSKSKHWYVIFFNNLLATPKLLIAIVYILLSFALRRRKPIFQSKRRK